MWYNVDPLAEQYQPFSGYNYVMNNPISNIDPDGMQVLTDYKLLKNGEIQRANPLDGSEKNSYDTLYATDSRGNVDKSKSVTVDKENASDGSVISDLSRTSGFLGMNEGIVSAGYTNNVDDAVNVYNFLNANTNEGIEFGLGRFLKNGSAENYLLTTQHSIDDDTGGFNYMTKYIGGFDNLISFYHNHDGYNGNHPDEVGNQWGDGAGGDQRTRRIVQTQNLKTGNMLSRFFTVHQGIGNILIEYTKNGHRKTGVGMTPTSVKSINKINIDNVK